MVDFKRLQKEHYARATPEERARIADYHEREARYDETRRTITGNFTSRSMKRTWDFVKGRDVSEPHITRQWTADIEMRIEDRTAYDGRQYEIIRFIEAVTGHEAYELSREFVEIITDDKPGWEPDRLTICAGGTRYDECWVSTSDVIAYLSELRPYIVPEHLRPEPVAHAAQDARRPPWFK